MKRTLYQILGVEAAATAEAIAAAYRAKLETLQAAPGSDAAAMTLLREAYQVLSNAPQRAAYDASLAAPVPSGVARRGRAVAIDDDESSGAWMRWAIGGSVVLIALGLWWWKARPASKPGMQGPPRVVITQPAAPLAAEPAAPAPGWRSRTPHRNPPHLHPRPAPPRTSSRRYPPA